MLAGADRAAAQPDSRLKQVADDFLDRVVQIATADNGKGHGFVVGESIDAEGRPAFLVVTADHVVRNDRLPSGSAPPQVTYCADLAHTWQAKLLDREIPPEAGDLAVLEVPMPPGLSLKPAMIAPGFLLRQ